MTAAARGERIDGTAATRGALAPIDLVHLAHQTFGSAELEREVLSLFVAQSRGLVAAIVAGTERAASLHRLKGSARGIGAGRIADLAEALEAPNLAEAEIARLIAALVAAEVETRAFAERLVGAVSDGVASSRRPTAT